MQKIATYIASVYYLKPTQFYHRVRLLLRKKLFHPSRWYRSRYAKIASNADAVTPIVFGYDLFCESALDTDTYSTFTFLNRRVNLGRPINWFPAQEDQLWLYNLHYFDYVRTLGFEYVQGGRRDAYDLFRRLVCDWMQRVPLGTAIAWDPYPTSLRLSNWFKAYTLFAPELERDRSFADEFRRSLYVQAAFLEKHLEYDLLNNHLLENGRALWLAGEFFADRNARRWQKNGRAILWRGLEENFLTDGGHDERSPMYHQIMLDLYQDMANVYEAQGTIVPVALYDKIQGMREWLAAMVHPDGKIALLNDSAFGVAPEPADSIGVPITPPEGLHVLPDSGYFTFRDSQRQNYLVFDCGPLGPEHHPGHGHCDALSYELTVGGQRIIVDSGVETYHGDLDWRTFYRSTRAHNTIVVDHQEQSEIWHRFRVARRARPRGVAWQEQGTELVYVTGCHTGYQRLDGKVFHQRWVCWIDRRFWVVWDRLTGRGAHELESFIHFHPNVEVRSLPTGPPRARAGEVALCGAILKVIPLGLQDVNSYFGELNPIQGWYAPEFGLRFKNRVWGFRQRQELPTWCGYVLWPESAELTVRFTPVAEDSARVWIDVPDATYELHLSPETVRTKKVDRE